MSDSTPASAVPPRSRRPELQTSESAFSTASHDSVTVAGTHPFGTLHVHQPARETPPVTPAPGQGPPPLGSADDEDGDDTPMDQGAALTHGKGGGDVVLILDLPQVYTVGYDAIAFTAKHFGGVRDLPAGSHLFWVAHPEAVSTRSGFWVFSSGQNQVHVAQWDKFTEVLSNAPHAVAHMQAENIDSFHEKLVPHRDPSATVGAGDGELGQSRSADNIRIWDQMTNCITTKTVSRVTGHAGPMWHVHTMDRVKGALLMTAEMELNKSISNPLLQTREFTFGFDQHSKTYSAQRIGAERTFEATDATSYILSVVDDPDGPLTEGEVVGELQFAFATGVHLGNEACMEQWWYMLLKLILKAYTLPVRRPSLATSLLRAIAAQLTYGSDWLDSPLLETGDPQARELRLSLIIYKRRLEEQLAGTSTPEHTAVGTTFARLESVVTTIGWDIRGDYLRKGKVVMEDGEEIELEMKELQAEDERGEWAPEVVELDEQGRERGLVSWND
ncbi:hypothetical protein K4F52_000043 [Lecanicillium sp. MT-2017a]|nr:hypothetical protein K4F52_000043 [Lecanicillium sp. MT-2017a]